MLAFDIETTGLQPDKCLVTVVCTQDYFTGERRVYEFARVRDESPEDTDELLQTLVQQFDAATSLCAFNGVRFDIPFLQTAYNIGNERVLAWMLKTSDILEQCRLLHNCTFSLNMLCSANGVQVKSSSGLEAVYMAQRREWQRLRDYCADDVQILCDLYRMRTLINPRTKAMLHLSQIAHPALYLAQPRPPPQPLPQPLPPPLPPSAAAERPTPIAGHAVRKAVGQLRIQAAELSRAIETLQCLLDV